MNSLSHLKAIGLDVDGVLRDTGYAAYEALRKTVVELGGTPPLFNDFVQGYSSQYLEYYWACGVSASQEEIYAVFSRHVSHSHDQTLPYDDVVDLLRFAESQGFIVFAVSTHNHERLNTWLSEHTIAHHFAHVKGGTRDKVACLTEACNILGIDPAAACYVGDWGLDMKAARTVGLLPIGITRGYDSRRGLLASGAELVIDNLRELGQLLVP